MTLRTAPASAPEHCSACLNGGSVSGQRGGGRRECLGVEGGVGAQEDFMEEVAAVKELKEGAEHIGPLQSFF